MVAAVLALGCDEPADCSALCERAAGCELEIRRYLSITHQQDLAPAEDRAAQQREFCQKTCAHRRNKLGTCSDVQDCKELARCIYPRGLEPQSDRPIPER
ncbi:MAG: hypothetical protein JRI23_28285 [Deltaproteobacteria bacterium]|jgi:hypothetical protein|nr:hypothetical protein [Deltaproteobacteria bacterium]MBW2535997.1 hypothetical protein [Deltaproteobacteria bacterium]